MAVIAKQVEKALKKNLQADGEEEEEKGLLYLEAVEILCALTSPSSYSFATESEDCKREKRGRGERSGGKLIISTW